MSGILVSTPGPRRTPTMTATLGALALALAACGSAGPPPVTFVLGTPPPARESVEPLARQPVIEVKPVLVPDYLDVADIMIRQAENVVTPSRTGRWGERLSVGVTRALALGLVQRLPDYIVTTTTPADRPARQILAEVETFEPRADGTVVLVARWRVLDGTGENILAGERVSLSEPTGDQSDAAIVAAMTRAVEEFTDRVAAGVRRTAPSPRARR